MTVSRPRAASGRWVRNLASADDVLEAIRGFVGINSQVAPLAMAASCSRPRGSSRWLHKKGSAFHPRGDGQCCHPVMQDWRDERIAELEAALARRDGRITELEQRVAE
jgi:hypothetical protein